MPWTESNYPDAMKHLTPAQRKKAIEIANATLGEGMDEGMAIAIGIKHAKGKKKKSK